MRRALTPCLLALLGFLGTTFALGQLVPWPSGIGLAQRLKYFEQHADEIDTVFVGSSFFFRGIIPAEFDALMQGGGRTLNLGAPGMTPFEADLLLREILAVPQHRVRTVFLDPPAWKAGFDPEETVFNKRNVNWHTLGNTRKALTLAANAPEPVAVRASWAWDHLRLFFWRASNYGTGVRIAAGLLGRNDRYFGSEDLRRDGGFEALDDVPGLQGRHEAFTADPGTWDALLSELRERNARATAKELDPWQARFIDEQVGFVRASGAQPVYVSVPHLKPDEAARAALASDRLPEVIDLNDPDSNPELFQVDLWFDSNHLNRAGAMVMTRSLAKRMSEVLPANKSGDGH